MMEMGRILVLNGAPRAGKSSIVRAIQAQPDVLWVNLGVDRYMPALPERLQPGIGLRPGGERPDLEPSIVTLYEALYASIAAHSRLGVSVVADVGHHDWYSRPLGILPRCARLLAGLPVWLIGVDCPLEEIVRRREETGYPARGEDGEILPPILRWQEAVHQPGLYDLRVDTGAETAEEIAARILARMAQGPGTAMETLASG